MKLDDPRNYDEGARAFEQRAGVRLDNVAGIPDAVKDYAKQSGKTSHEAKAALMWEAMDENERAGVRFGMFPLRKMKEAEAEGFGTHPLVCALMDCAKRDGGMRA